MNKHIIKKRVNLGKVPKVIEMFRERGVISICYFIAGFPRETKEMMEESIQYAATINADWCTFNAVKPLLGTPVYDEMVAENYIDHNHVYWSQTSYGAREFDTKEISKEDLNDLLYDANININSNIRDYPLSSTLKDKDFRSTKDIIEFLSSGRNNLYITTHPVRWATSRLNWIWELCFQSTKNIFKSILINIR